MADTEYAKITFSLPEDTDSDEILVFTSATEDGVYAADVPPSLPYQYGETTAEIADIDIALWYKIQFRNSVASKVGPLSEAVEGEDWTNKGKPELYISTTTDGAHYATEQDVYDYVHGDMDPLVVLPARVSDALKSSRAIIDLRCAEMDLSRFANTFQTDVARRKYNAALHVLKEAEINFALGMIYRGLAQDTVGKIVGHTLASTKITDTTEDITITEDIDITKNEATTKLEATIKDQTITKNETIVTAIDAESTGAGDWDNISIGQTSVGVGGWAHAMGPKSGTVTKSGTEVLAGTGSLDGSGTLIGSGTEDSVKVIDAEGHEEEGFDETLTGTSLVSALDALAERFMKAGYDLLTMLHPVTIPVTHSGRYTPLTPLQRVKVYGG